MNYDKTELATCYKFLTIDDKVNKKVTLHEMKTRGWSRQFVQQAILEGCGEDVTLTPRLTDHGVGYYDIDFAG